MANIGDIINGYEIVRELNVGNYCTAYEVMKDGRVYFFKEYSDPTRLSSDYNCFLENQRRMIPKLNALGYDVEKIVEDFEAKYRYCQVKKFITGVNLRVWMANHINFSVRKSLSIAMCKAVDSIHKAGIIHQDLKPEQFMVVADTKSDCGSALILTDFDWSVVDGVIVRYVGTHLYNTIDSEKTYKTDIFTLGIILSELLTGRNPYTIDSTLALDENEMAEYWRKLVSEKRFESPIKLSPHNITPEISSAITRCLDPDPGNRPEIEEIIYALEFDKLRFVPLIKSVFVPVPYIDTTVNIAIVKNTPALIERIAKHKIEFVKPSVLLQNMVQKKADRVKFPDFVPLHNSIKEDSFAKIIRDNLDAFRCIVANLIKEVKAKNKYNDSE